MTWFKELQHSLQPTAKAWRKAIGAGADSQRATEKIFRHKGALRGLAGLESFVEHWDNIWVES